MNCVISQLMFRYGYTSACIGIRIPYETYIASVFMQSQRFQIIQKFSVVKEHFDGTDDDLINSNAIEKTLYSYIHSVESHSVENTIIISEFSSTEIK